MPNSFRKPLEGLRYPIEVKIRGNKLLELATKNSDSLHSYFGLSDLSKMSKSTSKTMPTPKINMRPSMPPFAQSKILIKFMKITIINHNKNS